MTLLAFTCTFSCLQNGLRKLAPTHVHAFSWHGVKTSCVAQEDASVMWMQDAFRLLLRSCCCQVIHWGTVGVVWRGRKGWLTPAMTVAQFAWFPVLEWVCCSGGQKKQELGGSSVVLPPFGQMLFGHCCAVAGHLAFAKSAKPKWTWWWWLPLLCGTANGAAG